MTSDPFSVPRVWLAGALFLIPGLRPHATPQDRGGAAARGKTIDQLKDRGIDRNGALNVIAEFLDREILYAPHASDV
jgi:hypothetical protein